MRRRLGPKASRWLMALRGCRKKLTSWSVGIRAENPRGAGPPTSRFYTAITILEFAARRGLVRPDPAGHDIGPRVVFPFDSGAGQPAQHRELADVGQRIGNRALE